jgi:hypothetical protein
LTGIIAEFDFAKMLKRTPNLKSLTLDTDNVIPRGKQQDFRLQRLHETSTTETSDFYKTSIDFIRLLETS